MTTALGRMLTGLGVAWMGWAIVTGLVRIDPDLSLPFLPGLLFFFVGRALTKAGRREPLEDAGPSWQEPQRQTPAPPPRRRQVSTPGPEIRHQPEPETPVEHLPEIPDLEAAILDAPPPMSSEEMLAEARRQFGPRPFDDRTES
jgi:hypothetical protein